MDPSLVALLPNQRLIGFLIKIAYVGSILALLIGIFSLIGWQLKISLLNNFLPHIAGMHPLSAIGFICASIAFLTQLSDPDKKLKIVPLAFSIITLLIGIIALTSFLSSSGIALNEIFFKNRTDGIDISLNSTVIFILVGTSLLIFQLAVRKWLIRLAQIFILLTAAISMLAVIGYMYQTLSFYDFAKHYPMPLSSAITAGLLSIAILFGKSSRGLIKVITRETPSSKLAFRLILITLILPAVIGYISLQGEKLGLYDTQTAIALIIVGNIIFITTIVWLNTSSLQRLELEELIIKKTLENKNINLEFNEKELASKMMSLEEENKQVYDKLSQRDKLMDIEQESQ